MSELSVNEHLEGILSDFEALKRSFETEDVDNIPSSSASPISTTISPSSSRFFLNHKATEGHGGDGQLSSFISNNNSLGSTAHHSYISLSSSPSPVLKSRAVVSSLSFNRGTMNKPAIHQNGSSVARASSFQSRLNPNSYSILSRPGSDNDSLHSSTSSLEYSGGAPPPTKLGSYPSPPFQAEYQRTQPRITQQHPEGDGSITINCNLKKFSSHGSVFQTETDPELGVLLGIPQPQVLNHGSMPSLDLQIPDGGGVSPGLRYANANWNGHNHSPFPVETYQQQQRQQQSPKFLNSPQIKLKETLRLNKFPLDLESLVSNPTARSSAKHQEVSIKSTPPVPPPRNTSNFQHHTNPPPTSASPPASLSSLDSSFDSLPLSHDNPLSPCSPTPSQGSVPIPDMGSSPVHLTQTQSPHMEIHPRSQTLQTVPRLPRSSSRPLNSRALNDGAGDTKDSVGSILQRIASFSRPVVSETPGRDVTQQPAAQSNGQLSSTAGRPAVTLSMASRKQGKKNFEERVSELETEPLALMEEREEEEERSIMREQKDEGKSGEQADNTNTKNSLSEKERTGVDACLVVQEDKGKDDGEMKIEVQMKTEQESERYQCVPDQQVNFIQGKDLFGYVGIEAVLEQMKRKTMKAGFEFNIMVVGQSGLGKSTLINTLFKSKVSRKSCMPNHTEEISKTVKLHSVSHVIEENGVKMKLTVIDTPGFGDQINNENCWEPIVKYVNEQYEKYLREELHVNRKRRIPDTRVHCCIYFLPATGHRLRPIDVEFMKRLGKIVSIVPVIAKADTLTIDERQEFKERIRQDLAANEIQVYPQKEYDEDPEEHLINNRIRESIPFAVVGTDKEHQVNGNKVLGRKTKWGIIEVENVAHCEFANLRDLLIRTHLNDLKDVTHNIHYETYRIRRLSERNVSFAELGRFTWPLENGTADCESDGQH